MELQTLQDSITEQTGVPSKTQSSQGDYTEETGCPNTVSFKEFSVVSRYKRCVSGRASLSPRKGSNKCALLNMDEKSVYFLLFTHKFSRLILSTAAILAVENARASVTLTFLGKKAEFESNS